MYANCKLSSVPLLSDLKLPMNLTYSYTGGSLGSMAPRSMWQQNSIWFLPVDKKKAIITASTKLTVQRVKSFIRNC